MSAKLNIPLAVVLVVMTWPASAAAQDACMTAFEATQELRKSGKLIEAHEQALSCGQGSCPDVIGKKCREWVTEIDAITPSVVVVVKDREGSDSQEATLQIDGEAHTLDGRAIKLNPGTHVFVAQLPGEDPLREEILIGEGDANRRIELSYAPEGAPDPTPDGSDVAAEEGGIHVLVWVGLGVAVAGAVAGGITGGLALAGGSTIDENCNDKLCPESEREDYDRSLLLAHISTVSFAVAGAGAALGIVGIILSDFGSTEQAHIRPIIGPTWIGMGGSF